MNASKNSTLEDMNNLMYEHNKPVLIFITIFMLFGILGNSLVLYVYTFRIKRSTLKVFILYLGLVDMLGCCLAVPLELVNQILPLMYPSNILCKLHQITVYFSCIASVLALFVIAVERFNRVCRPFALQTSPQRAKWIVISITVISLLLVIPVCLVFERLEILLHNGVVSYQCWQKVATYWKVYFLILSSSFWLFLSITFVLYFFIWKRARLHFRQIEARRNKQSKDEADHLTYANHQEAKHNSSQINMTIFGITALFAFSFAPNFILNLAEATSNMEPYAFISILHRLWVLNCSLNPLVYGICNGEFRQEFKSLFFLEITQKSTDIATKNMATGSQDADHGPIKFTSVT